MAKHIMIDLETWSTKPNATIISIGAVAFDPNGDGVDDRFHVAIDPSLMPEMVQHQFHMDPSTMKWWLAEDRAAARAHWNAQTKLDLGTALVGFSEWFDGHTADLQPDIDGRRSIPIWGNGATFDNVILRRSYELVGLVTPWAFWHDRCYRTLKGLAGVPKLPSADSVSPGGVAHSALFDAERQALHLQDITSVFAFTPG